MTLFRHLSDDAFLIFSRKHRFAYEAALLACYREFFSAGAAYPTPKDVIRIIYETLGRHPELIGDDDDPTEGLPEVVSRGRRRIRFAGEGNEAGDRALAFATRLYQGLVRSGWLEEDEWGLRVTVDMPLGPQFVVERLDTLSSDISQRFGGVVVVIKTSLELVERLGETSSEATRGEAAHALRHAQVHTDSFIRTLRAILSDLRRIRKSITESQSLKQKMTTYFDEFIGELVLKDFQDILTRNHPYRFRDQIIELARRIAYSDELLDHVGRGYFEIQIGRDPQEAVEMAMHDLLSLETAFEVVGGMFDRIHQFRRGLEARLRNTVKYAERGERGLVARAGSIVRRMNARLCEEPKRYATASAPTWIRPNFMPWSASQLPKARKPRSPMQVRPLEDRPEDPLYELRKRLKAEYLERIQPRPEDVRRFLDARVAPGQEQSARDMAIDDVDAFLAFDALRHWSWTNDLPPVIASAYEITGIDGPPHDSDWLRCDNFIIRRFARETRISAR